jgi:ATP adenylyltransferase
MFKGELSDIESLPSDVESNSGLLRSERLWTPWRMKHVGGNTKRPDCVFCGHLAANHDTDSLILRRGKYAFVIMNLYPYNTGHVMIIPNEHVPSPEDLPQAALLEMATLRNTMLHAIRTALSPTGFNVGINLGEAAGAGIAMHLHEHIVPRWTGDANFMPIVGGTKVLPELLPATYAKLQAELNRGSAPIVVHGVFFSDDGTEVFVAENGYLPRVSAPTGTAVWRAISDDALSRGVRGSVILGWGGIDESLNGAPIIVHRLTEHLGNRRLAGGEWVPIDRMLSGSDGPLLSQVRRLCPNPDPEADSN